MSHDLFHVSRFRILGFGIVLLGLCPFAAKAATPDFTWTFDNQGDTSYLLTAVSSTQVYDGTLNVPDPVINLILGKRYSVTIVDAISHPFDVLAIGATDTVLLAQGGGVGSLEADGGIDWQDLAGGVVEFTVTQSLVDGMTAGGATPGYRCQSHPLDMRSTFQIFGTGTVTIGTTQPTGNVIEEWPAAVGGTANLAIRRRNANTGGGNTRASGMAFFHETDYSITAFSLTVSVAGTYPAPGEHVIQMAWMEDTDADLAPDTQIGPFINFDMSDLSVAVNDWITFTPDAPLTGLVANRTYSLVFWWTSDSEAPAVDHNLQCFRTAADEYLKGGRPSDVNRQWPLTDAPNPAQDWLFILQGEEASGVEDWRQISGLPGNPLDALLAMPRVDKIDFDREISALR